MTFDPMETIEQLGLVAATANLSAREAKMAYAGEVCHQLRGWVGKDAAREDATAALDVWVRRHALSDEIRDRVLSNFDPRRVDKEGADFLGEGPEHFHTPDDGPCWGKDCLTAAAKDLSGCPRCGGLEGTRTVRSCGAPSVDPSVESSERTVASSVLSAALDEAVA